MFPETDKIMLPIYLPNPVTGEDVIYYIDWEAYTLEQDWRRLSEEEFYKKYPHLKPNYPPAKVILDESDKRQ